MHKKSKIFLSYSSSDRQGVLDKFINDLKKLPNVTLWIADQQLANGDSVLQSISKAISDSDYFIQIISNEISNWADYEIQLAYAEELKNQNLKIITTFFRDSSNIDTRERILGTGRRGIIINFSGDYEGGFIELLKYINVNSSDSIASFALDTSIDKHTIINISSLVNEKLITYFSNHPDKMKIMDRRLFEEFIAEIFYGFGFEVELTKQTRDGGRDIIAIKKAETELKYLIECKRPDPGNIIGIKPVRELFGVKQDEKATKAILATTSYFSKDAIMFFERNKWELEPKDFNGIMRWINDYKRMKNIT